MGPSSRANSATYGGKLSWHHCACDSDLKRFLVCVAIHLPTLTFNNPFFTTEWVSAFDKEYIGMKKASRLCSAPKTCWDYLDFTYFQTFVTIPRNWALTEFSIVFSGMDDGSRVSVYNSAYVKVLASQVVPGLSPARDSKSLCHV